MLKQSIPVPILFATRELDYGGIERDVANIALQLDRSRFAPHVASYQASGVRHTALKQAGVPLLHIPLSSLRSRSAFSCALQLLRYLKKHRIQIVHAWDTSAVFVAPVARLARVPSVLISSLTSRSLLDKRSRMQMRLIDRVAHAVVVNCEFLRADLIANEGTSPDKIIVCRNGIDTSEFCFDQQARSFRADQPTLTIRTVCVLRAEKRVDLLLQAFAKLSSVRENIQLLIVGDGPEGLNLRKCAERLGLLSDAIFASATRDVASYLQDTDIFVLPSSSEASSNALMEAMACGCCTLASRVGGNIETINDGKTGLLFESGSIDDLCAKLSLLIDNKALRSQLGLNASVYARKERSITAAAGCLAAFYDQLMSRTPT